MWAVWLVATLALAVAAVPVREYANCRTIDGPQRAALYWTATPTYIRLAIEAKANNWIGVGVSGSHLMADGLDAAIGLTNSSGAGVVVDAFCNSSHAVRRDTVSNLDLPLVHAVDGLVTLEFGRFLNTGDTVGDRVWSPTLNWVLAAWRNSNSPSPPAPSQASPMPSGAHTSSTAFQLDFTIPSTCGPSASVAAGVGAFLDSESYASCVTVSEANQVYFQYNPLTASSLTLSGALTGPVVGGSYIAWGVHSTNTVSMAGGDFLVGYLGPGGTSVVRDMYLPSTTGGAGSSDTESGLNGRPLDKPWQRYIRASFQSAGTVCVLQFERPVGANSSMDNPILISKPMSLMWASSVSGSPWELPLHSARGNFFVDLTARQNTCPNGVRPTEPSRNLTEDDFVGAKRFDDWPFLLRWVVDRRAGTIRFAMSAPVRGGWLGIGFPSTVGMMGPADVYVAWMSAEGVPVVSDRAVLSTLHPTPVPDAVQSLLAIGGVANDESLTLYFERALNTADKSDAIIGAAPQPLTWAIGADAPGGGALSPLAALTMHNQHSDHPIMIDFANTASSAARVFGTARRVHAWMMGFGWAMAVPVAVLIAKFGRPSVGALWFPVHVALVGTTVLATVVTVAVMLALPDGGVRALESSNARAHAIFGLVIATFAVVQTAIGIWSGVVNRRRGGPARACVPTRSHAALGVLLMLAAFCNCFVGLAVYQADASAFGLVAVSLLMTVLALAFAQLRGVARARGRLAKVGPAAPPPQQVAPRPATREIVYSHPVRKRRGFGES